MTTYYISGPMRGKPRHNADVFNSVEDALLKQIHGKGYEGEDKIINPSRNFGGDQTLKPGVYMALDLQQVLEADVIVQLPGWQASEGACREAQLGVWADKDFMAAVLYQECQTDMGLAQDWQFRLLPNGPEFSTSPRASALDEAKQLITGDRNNAYGPPTQDFQRTAAMANGFGFQVNGKPLESHHVAIFMILLKMSRLAWTPTKRDSWVDTGGYAGCGYECAITEEAERLAEAERTQHFTSLREAEAERLANQ